MISKDVERDGLQEKCWSTVFKYYKELFGDSDLKIARYLLEKMEKDPERVINVFGLYYPNEARRLRELGGIK